MTFKRGQIIINLMTLQKNIINNKNNNNNIIVIIIIIIVIIIIIIIIIITFIIIINKRKNGCHVTIITKTSMIINEFSFSFF